MKKLKYVKLFENWTQEQGNGFTYYDSKKFELAKEKLSSSSEKVTAIKFLEWYRRKGVIYQFHAYHIQGSDDTIYLNADQLFEIFEKENYEK